MADLTQYVIAYSSLVCPRCTAAHGETFDICDADAGETLAKLILAAERHEHEVHR